MFRIQVAQRIYRAGMSNFFASRDDYTKYRKKSRQFEYLTQAKKSIHVISLWMAYGTEAEDVPKQLAKFVSENKDVSITLAVINPKVNFLDELDDYLDIKPGSSKTRIQLTLGKMSAARKTLGVAEQNRFNIRVYNVLPTVSLIALDMNEKNGVIQADMKLYKASRQNSYGLEFCGQETPLFKLFKSTVEEILKKSEEFDESVHLI